MVIAGKGGTVPRAKKTGTTIVGVVYKDGVVLGADTRATEGDTVADKNVAGGAKEGAGRRLHSTAHEDTKC